MNLPASIGRTRARVLWTGLLTAALSFTLPHVLPEPAYAATPPASGDVFISDTGHGRVLRVSAGGGGQFEVATGLSYAAGLAVDATGDVLVADQIAAKVLRLPADGGPQTTLGTGLARPFGVAVDASGDVLIADRALGQVVRVPAGGGAQTTVGTGLANPNGVAVDALGNVFIADTGNDRVVRVPVGGGAQTTVGTGLDHPNGVAVDAAGNVLIADTGNARVVRVPADGGAQTTVGTGLSSPAAAVFDAAGDVLIADPGFDRVVRVPAGGGGQSTVGTGLATPFGVAVYAPAPTFLASSPPTSATVGASFAYTYTATTPSGQPTARFRVASGALPPGLTLNPATGSLSGIPTAAGSFTFRVQTENAANATLDDESTVVVAPTPPPASGDVFISDTGHGRVLRVSAGGGGQFEVATGLSYASGMAVDATGDVLVADPTADRVLRLPADGGPQTTVGTGLADPFGVAVDANGDVLIADASNDRVLRVPVDGGAQTTVGTGLDHPSGVAVDAAGNVFIANGNDRVVRVPAGGGAQTTVGTGLNTPTGVAIDTAGNVLIADPGNARVVRVPADGGAQTTVGTGLSDPYAAVFDAVGDVLIADAGNDRVVRVPADGGAQSTVGTGLATPHGVAVYAPAPTFLASSPAETATVGTAYSYTYTASTPAGQPAARFRVASGTLPPGLSLNPATGSLSGTPTAAGSFTFQVQTENAATATLDDESTVAVAPTPPPASGDVFISDTGHIRVLRVPAGGGGQFEIATGVTYAAGLAVDATGDVLVANPAADRVLRLPADGGPQTTVGTGLSGPFGVAVDVSRDVLIADASNDRVVRVPAGGGPQTTVGTGLLYPNGVAVDALGNVFIADTHNNRVVRVPVGGGAQTTVGTGLLAPTGVAVDTAGNVLIADAGNDRVVRAPAGGGAQTTVGTGLSSPYAAVFDAVGDVLIADAVNNRVLRVPADGGAQSTVGTGLSSPNAVAVYAPAPTFLASSPPAEAKEGTSYSYTYTASTPAGQPAARFRVASGTLPPGLTLNPTTGVLSGKPTEAGSYTFRVQTENAANATVDAPVTIVVDENKATQTVTFTSAPPAHARVGDSYSPSATGGASGNPVVLTVIPRSANVCSIIAGVVRFEHVGTCVVRADQSGDGTYWPGHATQSILVDRGLQSIVFTSTPPTSPHPGETYTPTARGGGSGLPVLIAVAPASDGACSISAGKVTFDAPGTCELTADQGGNADYEPATQARQVIEVDPLVTVVDPQITADVASALPTRRGWYRTPVTVSFDCTPGSGALVDGCPDPVTLSRNRADQQITRTITSVDGGRDTATVSGIHIDRKRPSVRVMGVTKGDTYAHVRTIKCRATDRHSGIHKCVVKTRRHHQPDGDVVVHYRVKAVDIAGNQRMRRGHYTIDR